MSALIEAWGQGNLGGKYMSPPALFFLLKIVLASQGLLILHLNFRMDFFISAKNIIGIFIGITLNL